MPITPLIDRAATSQAGLSYGSRQTGPQKVYVQRFSATLAEINAGKTIKPIRPGQLVVLDFMLRVTGGFATAVDVRLSDLSSGPVDIATIAIAQMTNGAKHTPESANVTLGAGFDAPLTPPVGLQIRKTGSAATGGTSVSGWIMYTFAPPAAS